MATPDVCTIIQSILSQKQQLALYNVPFPRFNLVSPYENNQYTETQLNMRRKCEILQYYNYNQNTKTNSFTKRQSFANLVKNGSTANKRAYCQNNSIPTPTSSCDVPGPVIMLQYDPTVPLYNFGNDLQNRSYAELMISMPNYQLYAMPSTFAFPPAPGIPHDVSQTTYTTEIPLGVLITNNTVKDVYSIKFQAPIFFWVRGVRDNTLIGSDIFQLQVQSVVVMFYYNDTVVNTINITRNNAKFIYDQTATNADNGYFQLSSISQSSTDEFYGTQYMGMLQVNSLQISDIPSPQLNSAVSNSILNVIYKVNVAIKYTYNYNNIINHVDNNNPANSVANKLISISTGFTANGSSPTSSGYVYQMSFLNPTPDDFSTSSFIQYPPPVTAY